MADLKAPALSPGLIQQAESARTVWSIEIPPGVSFQNLLRPDFWCHCTNKFRRYDMIEARAQDNAWFGTLMVAEVSRLSIKMWPLSRAALSLADTPLPEAVEYTVTHGGPQAWRVIRLIDKEVIHKGEPTKESAEKWLADFVAGKVEA